MDNPNSKIFIGNLPPNVVEDELKDVFAMFGAIKNIKVVKKVEATYGFIEFEERESALQAIEAKNRASFKSGSEERFITVQVACKKYNYPVLVENLPPSVHWREVKDHFSDAGKVVFVKMGENGQATVDFETEADRGRALGLMNNTIIRTRNGAESVIALSPLQGTHRRRSVARSHDHRSSGAHRHRSRAADRRSPGDHRSRTMDRRSSRCHHSRNGRAKSPEQHDYACPYLHMTQAQPSITYKTNGYMSPGHQCDRRRSPSLPRTGKGEVRIRRRSRLEHWEQEFC